jgi:pimeloyl-ACP methyl ester carboxylesterase
MALLACLACAAPATAADRVTTIAGAPGPGPSKYDKVFVTKFGPKSAKRVLVLVPGYYGGAGDFTLDARELVKRVPGLQVWAVDRRSEALEDTSRFKDALAGRITVQQALDYYQGKRVILGGHSLGASMTVAYASWDSGADRGTCTSMAWSSSTAGSWAASRRPTSPRRRRPSPPSTSTAPSPTCSASKLPWTAGVFAEVGALAALKEPTAPSAVQSFALLPPELKPPIPATNRGAFGFAFDAANALARNAQTDYLKLRPWHRREVDLPLYAVQTDLTGGRVLLGARRFIAGSKVPRSRSVLVDASSDESHLDPLTAAPDRNSFLKTVVPFLRTVR